MSTLTMLAVSKAPSPYEALAPEARSSTATDTSAWLSTDIDRIAPASTAAWSTVG